MNKNIDLCSAVECTAAHPCLTKSHKEEEISFFSISVLLLASVKRFGVSRMQDFSDLFCIFRSFLVFHKNHGNKKKSIGRRRRQKNTFFFHLAFFWNMGGRVTKLWCECFKYFFLPYFWQRQPWSSKNYCLSQPPVSRQ